MDPLQKKFAKASRRLYKGAEIIHRAPLPARFKIILARLLGRFFSPYGADVNKVRAGFQQGLGRSKVEAKTLARAWLGSHGLFALSIFHYRTCDARWVRESVRVERPDLLQALVERGGLVLTFHSFHQNTLAALVGLSGSPVFAVAGTEKNNPMVPYIGRYLRIINGGSEACFGGGRYLFTDEPRALIQGVRKGLEQHHSMVTLCDNPAPPGSVPPLKIMGRSISVGTGVLSLVQTAQAPVTFALLYPDQAGVLHLALQEAGVIEDLHSTLQAYFNFLEEQLKKTPWAWQGWIWWSDLPE